MAVPGRRDDQSTPLTRTSFRVVMADTDAARVIYFGAPVWWAERLVTTWLAEVECGTAQALADGYGLPAVHCAVDYASALRLDDRVDASLWVEQRTPRSVTFRSEFTRDGDAAPCVVVRVTQVQATTGGATLQAVPLRPRLVAALSTSPDHVNHNEVGADDSNDPRT